VRSSSTTPLFAKTSTDIYFVARPSNEKIRSLELEISRLKEQLLGSKASTIALIELDDNNSLSEQDHESDLPFASTSIMTCNHPLTPIDTPKILYCADPVQTLINPEDRTVAQAAYWHSYSPDRYPTKGFDRNWTHRYKGLCSAAFWGSAQEDATLLQTFVTYAAAKEIAVRGGNDNRAYLVHKSRALQMISADVQG
jgi:hypothetical protein